MPALPRLAATAAIAAAWASPASAQEVTMFATPSGNIYCEVLPTEDLAYITCTIREREGPPAWPALSGCAAGQGHGFTMYGRSPVEAFCAEDSVDVGGLPVVAYGQRVEWPGITCDSSEQGLDCGNSKGYGFFLSRRTQRIY